MIYALRTARTSVADPAFDELPEMRNRTEQVAAMDVRVAADSEAFERAWAAFAAACSDTVAPEATYQAWLAHFAIQEMDLLRVVREVDFGARHLGPPATEIFTGHSLMVDILVLREPVVLLPRRAALATPTLPDGQPNPRSGLKRLGDFSVITELKVHATQGEGLDQAQVIRDFQKLSVILNAAERDYPENPLPAAFVGVLANHPKRSFNFDLLKEKLAKQPIRSDVRLLDFPHH